MDTARISLHVEALIFASEKPISIQQLTDVINQSFGFISEKIEPPFIQIILNDLILKYKDDYYPFLIKETGAGYLFLSKKEFFHTIGNLNSDKYTKKLSNAALETLSIIAYKQPITKAEVEKIRGVNCDYSIQKLLEKELIYIEGRMDELPGRPLIYRASNSILDFLGLNSWEALPKINEIVNSEQVPSSELTTPDNSFHAELKVIQSE
ncbi:MAG: SMC-Scp complex subunit ScpB [Sediminibacterium sp.]|nr:SMC-Scp complex subunit ScpB [Sediminibacterium sp.]